MSLSSILYTTPGCVLLRTCAGSSATPMPTATRLTMLVICHASSAIRG
ncbi:hypothetical protein BURPSS13_B0007 [Burkholderia pseudomallei S13]|nr:hypothetical protein BURPSS13_B0007 [Burkholderia pseudomallei S13]